MNKYLAYPFLYDDANDLKCDFEILTDEISSLIGLLRSLLCDKDKIACPDLAEDLSKINELMYHINPSLRTEVEVAAEELEWLAGKNLMLRKDIEEGQSKSKGLTFYLPQGSTPSALSHVIRCKCKVLVRLISRYQQQGNHVDDILFDFANLYSGYFYSLALWFNKIQGIEELKFISRVY